jgi:hypothetical protein
MLVKASKEPAKDVLLFQVCYEIARDMELKCVTYLVDSSCCCFSIIAADDPITVLYSAEIEIDDVSHCCFVAGWVAYLECLELIKGCYSCEAKLLGFQERRVDNIDAPFSQGKGVIKSPPLSIILTGFHGSSEIDDRAITSTISSDVFLNDLF